jgi:N-hydroxyarylamine O-acetyltransferase
MPVDLDAYWTRIGYRGDRRPTLETLRALHRQHPQAIPFENLDPLLGITPQLENPGLEEKLVRSARGGYCFEQNLLFRHVLEAIGFRVTGYGARVIWGAPPGVTTPRTHMLLRIDLPEGAYIADVGFGGLVLTAPLRLIPDVAQETPHERFRLATTDAGYRLEVELGREWRPLYRFDLTEQHLIDYQVANWFTSTYPRSIFRNGLMMARVEDERRYALRNAEFATHHPDGRTERRTLASVREVRDVLTDVFQIRLPEHAELDPAIQRVLESAP